MVSKGMRGSGIELGLPGMHKSPGARSSLSGIAAATEGCSLLR